MPNTLSRWKKKLADEEGVNKKKQKAPDGWCEVKTKPDKQILPSGKNSYKQFTMERGDSFE